MKQFLYQLKLVERFKSDSDWTKEDEMIVSEHFNHLKKLTSDGVVLLAGRTGREYEDGFGIVIFKADDWSSAEVIMLSDPSIAKGVMTGNLFEYHIALESLSKKEA